MDHLQNVLSYFDQQQPLCAEHDRIPKDLYREFGVKAGLRDETGKGVLRSDQHLGHPGVPVCGRGQAPGRRSAAVPRL